MNNFLNTMTVWRLKVLRGRSHRRKLVLLTRLRIAYTVLVLIHQIGWLHETAPTIEIITLIRSRYVKIDLPTVLRMMLLLSIATIVHVDDLEMLTQVADLYLLLWILYLVRLLFNQLRFLEWNARLRQQHLIILLLDCLVEVDRVLLLDLLLLFL